MNSVIIHRAQATRIAKAILPLLFLLFHAPAFSQKALPELWGVRVHDEAHVLSQQKVDDLELQLKRYEDSTSNQIAILLLPSLDGESIEDYSIRLVDKWKLGQKGKDNGALLLVAVNDHKMRIEVGDGLQGTLTDAVCSRIIRSELAPNFRQDDFDGGVQAAVNAMIAAIGGEYSADDVSSGDETPDWVTKLVLGLFVFSVLGVFTVLGIMIPDKIGWILYLFLIPFYAIFPMAIYGLTAGLIILGVYLIGYPVARYTIGKSAWGKRARRNKTGKGGGSSWGSGSGWSSSSGSSWSSSSSSGSSFSGGGGSFSGGGSSGSW
ncbi:TPM domain-containing protein [Chryseolinea lacunae]|uniref:TPM domain-containing protein n=1 Tax=Chryseolinea lacunae TaxID=2801331 RepID=A0ABS1KSX6_9BACT|nr:TPM domain-containing protein [Chryseolinea lacunae]MBL0741802.1 TPM domain-containing protein [Chryseolinea lacunae]